MIQAYWYPQIMALAPVDHVTPNPAKPGPTSLVIGATVVRPASERAALVTSDGALVGLHVRRRPRGGGGGGGGGY
jgi:hypothetical protein